MGFKNAAKFPANIVGVADLGNMQDYIAGTTKPTLAGNINNSVTSFSVASGTGGTLPSDNFCITVDTEEMFVGSRSGDALSSITRGVNGTSAASHSTGAAVNHFIVANLVNQLAAEVNALQSSWEEWRISPDRPAASPNTMDDEFNDTTGNSGTNNGLNARWSWLNQGGATITYSKGWAVISVPSNGGSDSPFRFIYQALPGGTSWEMACKINPHNTPSNYHFTGMVLSESSTSKHLSFGWGYNGGAAIFIRTSAAGQLTATQWSQYLGGYLKIQRTGSTLNFYSSAEGVVWDGPILTRTVTNDFTTAPDRVGLGGDAYAQNTVNAVDWFRRLS